MKKLILITIFLLLLSGCQSTDHLKAEILILENENDNLEKDIANKHEQMITLLEMIDDKEKVLIEKDNQLETLLENQKPVYGRYIHDKNLFTQWIDKNPLDTAYGKALENGQEDYDLIKDYTNYWSIEMNYALDKIQELVEEESFEHLKSSQEAFKKAIYDSDYFLQDAFKDSQYKNSHYALSNQYKMEAYRNRTIDLLEYLFIIEGQLPELLYRPYESHDDIQAAKDVIDEVYWQEVDQIIPVEHLLSISTPDGIRLFKVHGYELILKVESFRRIYSMDRIEVCDKNFKSLQVLEFPVTIIPSSPSTDYGFQITDWNFDGYPDISLHAFEGGTMLNVPTYYWLWDSKEQKYTECDILNEISQTSYLTTNNQEVVASYKDFGYVSVYYEWDQNTLLPIRSEWDQWQNDGSIKHIDYLYIHGEWVEKESDD